MEELLRGWLASQHRLDMPGLGTLQIDTTAAQLDFANKCINPPVQQIVFADNTIKTDKNFYQYLSHNLHIDETNAIIQFTDFVTAITNRLEKNGTANLMGIGEFSTDQNKKKSFQPYQSTFQPYTALSAEKILRHNENFEVLQGDVANNSSNASDEIEHTSGELFEDNWWIAALILFAVGASAILFYYLN